jgi:hypothetical protein
LWRGTPAQHRMQPTTCSRQRTCGSRRCVRRLRLCQPTACGWYSEYSHRATSVRHLRAQVPAVPAPDRSDGRPHPQELHDLQGTRARALPFPSGTRRATGSPRGRAPRRARLASERAPTAGTPARRTPQ